ncbi:NUDIX hydrolase [Nocardia sp. MDA0666]|uniref:NUDIX hydrolase n=1 Tax=Nocardia sp. MDA0666 TaxID=2135448 RepID=UPI000D12BC38|nr:NUDIX domain-containing protein [Nocardia sp. MDA0666]PSR62271.1 NUDIX hydrolase [Nocardia sp. MDA0666]
MTDVVARPAHGSGFHRHKVTGDVHLVLCRNNEILFGRRTNTGFEDGAWHLPSGHLEADESVIEALIREAQEEVGITVKAEDVHFVHVMHNSSSGGRMAFFFSVRSWERQPENMEPDKCAELQWFSANELPEHMIDYCRVAMGHIASRRSFSTYGW